MRTRVCNLEQLSKYHVKLNYTRAFKSWHSITCALQQTVIFGSFVLLLHNTDRLKHSIIIAKIIIIVTARCTNILATIMRCSSTRTMNIMTSRLTRMELIASSTSPILPSTNTTISQLTHSRQIIAIPGMPSFRNCHQPLMLSQLQPLRRGKESVTCKTVICV